MRQTILTISLFLLAVAFSIPLWPTETRGQAGSFRLLSSFAVLVGDNVFVLDPFNPPVGWHQLPSGSSTLPPVPPSTLISLESGFAITESGEGWINSGGIWQSFGTAPGVSGVRQSTWGALKARYR